MLKYHNTVFFTNIRNGYYDDVLSSSSCDRDIEHTTRLVNEMVDEIITQFGITVKEAIQLISILKFKANLEKLWN